MVYITIDAGTTNTRAKIWRNNQAISQASAQVGVRDTAITGSRDKLRRGVKETIAQAMQGAGLQNSDVTAIIASGMITSELGLCEVPHLEAPAGIEDLARGMVCSPLAEVSSLPIWFIPGVKNRMPVITVDNCEQMDMMRGEEVETIGALEQLHLKEAAVFVLPGSHTKFVGVDRQQRITGCLTTMAGELLGVITQNTILADAVNRSFPAEINADMVLRGAHYSQSVGLGRTCFTLRILDRFTQLETEAKANFLLGALLGTDLLALKNSSTLRMDDNMAVVISGKKILKEAFTLLIRHDDFFQGRVASLPDEVAADIGGLGAVAIANRRGIITGLERGRN